MKVLKSIVLALTSLLMLSFLSFFQTAANHVDIPKKGQAPLLFATETRHDLQKSYVSAINQAKKSILIVIYSITDPKVIEALRKKSELGVDVTIICHENISYDIEKRVGSKVKVIKRFGKGLMHLKIMVIDKKISYIGSANLTSASLKMYGNLVTAFDSKELSLYLTKKAIALESKNLQKPIECQSFRVGGQLIEVNFLPDVNHATSKIKHLIRSAKKTIKVAMFTWTREDFAQEIIAASLRGVKTEIALDRSSSKGSSIKIFELLKNSAVCLRLNKGSELLHHKFLYIDEKILVNGSANWTHNAFHVNDDCFVVIHDLNAEQKNEMKNLWDAIKKNCY